MTRSRPLINTWTTAGSGSKRAVAARQRLAARGDAGLWGSPKLLYPEHPGTKLDKTNFKMKLRPI